MTNKTLGWMTVLAFPLAVVAFGIGSYTDALTAWDMIGTILSYSIVVLGIWSGIRLIRS